MKKKLRSVSALVLSAFLFLAGCSGKDTNEAITEVEDIVSSATTVTQTAGSTGINAVWSEEDLNTAYDESAVRIVGQGNSVEISGNGATSEAGNVTITKAGTYVLSGTFEGQIMVEATSNDFVHLVLEGVTITCEDSAAIYGSQSDKIVITLAEGTVNSVSDGQSYVYANVNEDEPNAAIFSKDDLTINGTGSLEVMANYQDGIRGKDDLWIVSGELKVTAVADAIQGKDSLWIGGGSFTINAGNDALKSSNDKESDKGWVMIDGGTFEITAADDAIHAESMMVIQGGDINILSCYEGIEGLTVDIYGGNISLYATDDGINAAGGSDETESFFGGGRMDGNENARVSIYGGNIYINANGDGIDSNGYFYVYGGNVIVEGPVNGANGPLDYTYGASIDEGTFIAAGSSQMAQAFSEDSKQPWILYNLSEWQQAGTTVTLTDSSGNEIYSQVLNKEYQSIVISAPGLTSDGTYILSCGSFSEEITLENGSYSNGSAFGFGGEHGGGNGGGRGNRQEFNQGENPEMPSGEMPEGMPEGERPEMPTGEMPEGMPEVPSE